jgi:hypothetical protein
MTNTHSQPHKQGSKSRNTETVGQDFTAEETYWRETYQREPYYTKETNYEDYAPAYRVGWEGVSRYSGKGFDDVEPDLRRDYESVRGKSRLTWEKAKSAARAAWHRVERALPGDADNDGR